MMPRLSSCRFLSTVTPVLLLLLLSVLLMLTPGSSGRQDFTAHADWSVEIQRRCPVLYLLNVEPYPYHDSPVSVWDRGLDLIPAGHLAADQVNNRTDILPGFDLKLIDIDSEACGIDAISKGTANVYRELVNPEYRECIVGVIGLFCSPVTNVISPIVNHPNIGGLVHIAASTSPIHRGCETNTTNLFHIIGSSSIFNDATFAMMKAFEWQRISLIYNSIQLYRSTTADDFTNKIHLDPNRELIAHVPLSDSRTKIFSAINGEEARISYWTVTYRQAAHLLCEAFKKHLLWPGYVYILHEPKVKKILQTKTSCSKKELMSALEGAFLLKYRLFVDDDMKLISGLSYSEFRRNYADELQIFANITGENLNECVYANSLYDQVWAFALALNNTLSSQRSPSMPSGGHMIRSIGQEISSSLKRELQKISFQGASGRKIHFGEKQESPSYVDIFQVQNSTEVLIGIYDPFSQNITFTERAPTDTPISDKFETFRILLPTWLGVFLLVAQGILFCLITTNLVLVILWRKEREIKATSPILSTVIMIGCYFLFVRSFILIVYKMFEIENTLLLQSLCMLKTWLSIGTDLIFATMLLRLLRIYRIFCTAPMSIMSNYWVDKYLLLYVIFLCLGKVVLLFLWSCLDPVHPVIKSKYVYQRDIELPHYETILHCSCNSVVIWIVVTKLYSGLLILMVVHLAIQTRHVKKSVYKDTKKVNIFIFFAVICLMITLPLWVIFLGKRIVVGAAIVEWLSLYTIPMLCQACLFVPKTLPVIIRKLKPRLRNTYS